MSETPWSQYDKAYKAIHDKIAEVLAKLDDVGIWAYSISCSTLRIYVYYTDGTFDYHVFNVTSSTWIWCDMV